MLDSTATVAAERQGKNARQLLESVAREIGKEGMAVSVLTVLELVQASLAPIHSNAAREGNAFSTSCQLVSQSSRSPCRSPPRRTDRRPKPSQGCAHTAIGSADRGKRSGTRLWSGDGQRPAISIDPRPERGPALAAPFPPAPLSSAILPVKGKAAPLPAPAPLTAPAESNVVIVQPPPRQMIVQETHRESARREITARVTAPR
jgi:hypothetical protein